MRQSVGVLFTTINRGNCRMLISLVQLVVRLFRSFHSPPLLILRSLLLFPLPSPESQILVPLFTLHSLSTMFARLFIAATLAVSVQTAFAASCSRTYTVQEADYCDKISAAQNVSTYQLAVSNADAVGKDCTNLQVGQQLCLATSEAEDCRTTYTVIPDDTCEGIAAKNGLNATILFMNNPQINADCSNIYVDECHPDRNAKGYPMWTLHPYEADLQPLLFSSLRVVLCTEKTVKVAPVPASGVAVKAPQTTIFVTRTEADAPAATPTTTPGAKPPVAKPAAQPAIAKPAPPAAAAAKPADAPAGDDGDCDADGSDGASNDNAGGDDDDCDDSADTAAPAKSSNDSGSDAGDDDDDDLPFCDEL
ncbi:hypothetical protein D9619_012310 [Psilocybe cf. subviscida]|uniref:LysM domain-containing protein n=1 Tax=Psilocybe cf. subviscida TaxID=2480587 RepID=A0A8H5AQT1_9AGAR|nr:hypothetical protein D9619_012310 [Psilocybe cf. subviscida]